MFLFVTFLVVAAFVAGAVAYKAVPAVRTLVDKIPLGS